MLQLYRSPHVSTHKVRWLAVSHLYDTGLIMSGVVLAEGDWHTSPSHRNITRTLHASVVVLAIRTWAVWYQDTKIGMTLLLLQIINITISVVFTNYFQKSVRSTYPRAIIYDVISLSSQSTTHHMLASGVALSRVQTETPGLILLC